MKVKKSTIIRIAALAAVLLNQVLAIFGKNLPFTEDAVYQAVSILLTVGVSAFAAWKNNDFTAFARLSGEVLDSLRDGKVTKEEVEKLLTEEESAE